MQRRIAVDLGGRGLQELDLQPLGQPQHIDRADHAGLGGLDGIELIMDRRGRAGEIVDLVDLDIERKRDVVAHQLERLMVEQMGDVAPRAGEKIVDAEHVVSGMQKPFAQMRAEKARAAGDENPFSHIFPMFRCVISRAAA